MSIHCCVPSTKLFTQPFLTNHAILDPTNVHSGCACTFSSISDSMISAKRLPVNPSRIYSILTQSNIFLGGTSYTINRLPMVTAVVIYTPGNVHVCKASPKTGKRIGASRGGSRGRSTSVAPAAAATKRKKSASSSPVGDVNGGCAEWQCRDCTFKNLEARAACGMCGRRRVMDSNLSTTVPEVRRGRCTHRNISIAGCLEVAVLG